MSMFQKATKRQLRARLALDGPTGSGKTWTALEWAQEFGGRIAVIDTERGSASLYSHRFDFDVLDMQPPYDPKRLEEALQAAESEGYDVVIVDSFSHFWEGEGGVLDVVDGAAQRAHGNSFAGWKTGTPMLRHLIDTMLGIEAHLIVTMRSKMEYILETDSRGKQVPKRVGMAPVMRAGVEFEFALIGDMDLEHRIVISKSRCDVLADQVIQPGRAAEAAQTFKAWLNEGEPLASRNDIDALKLRMNAIANLERRKECKSAFVAQFGSPNHLAESKVAIADELVRGYEDAGAPVDAAGDGVAESDRGTPAQPRLMTDAQSRAIFAMLHKLDVSDDERHGYVADIIGRPVESFSSLTVDEAGKVIEELQVRTESVKQGTLA